MEKELISYFLPQGLLQYFIITNVYELEDMVTKKFTIYIDLEEINNVPIGYDSSLYESKGLNPATIIQDFPVRGKAVYLSIKRRRWRLKENKNVVIQNNFSLIAEGSKITKELSDFLKGTGRYT